MYAFKHLKSDIEWATALGYRLPKDTLLETQAYIELQLHPVREELQQLRQYNEQLQRDLNSRSMELRAARNENCILKNRLRKSQQLNITLQIDSKHQNMIIAYLKEQQYRLEKELKASKDDAKMDMELMAKIARLGCMQQYQEEAPEPATKGKSLKFLHSLIFKDKNESVLSSRIQNAHTRKNSIFSCLDRHSEFCTSYF